jgi:hypothetical protein
MIEIVKLADGKNTPKELVICMECLWYRICPNFGAAIKADAAHSCAPIPGGHIWNVELPS